MLDTAKLIIFNVTAPIPPPIKLKKIEKYAFPCIIRGFMDVSYLFDFGAVEAAGGCVEVGPYQVYLLA